MLEGGDGNVLFDIQKKGESGALTEDGQQHGIYSINEKFAVPMRYLSTVEVPENTNGVFYNKDDTYCAMLFAVNFGFDEN